MKKEKIIEEKINEILDKMTLEEKVMQLGSVYITNLVENGKLSKKKMKKFLSKGIGEICRVVGGVIGMEPEVATEIGNRIQKFLKEETRLKIPALIHEECLSGYFANRATSFPQAIGMASTWNTNLVEKITSRIREQIKITGSHHGLAPVLDVSYDPRWGRTEETFGEDPYLVASIGVAYVKGLQTDELKKGVIATGKHFAGHGFSEGGRNCASVHLGERELREIFLFPFEACIKEAKLGAIMNAYHDIDGIPCACSKKLLTDILRKEWGFKGIVVSDYGAVGMLFSYHNVASSRKEAAKLALEAGIDIELQDIGCYRTLIDSVKEGFVSEEVLNSAVSRVLRMKFEMGLFDGENLGQPDKVKIYFDTPIDRELAFQSACESIILLKNNKVLPLKKDLKKIAVIGPLADNPKFYFGDYAYSSIEKFEKPVIPCDSVLKAIKEKVFPRTEVLYAKGCEITGDFKVGFKKAIEVAKKSDCIILVLGESSGFSSKTTSGEGRDRHDIKLPGVQQDLILELSRTEKPIILVLINGRPLNLSPIADKVDAILEAWFPGEEGAKAIIEILFGDYNPGGKLPVSFPKDSGQIPVYYHRKNSSFRNYVFLDSEPLFPFGHGLSYTQFEYSNLKIEPKSINSGNSFSVSFCIKNKGKVKGDEVVQMYIKDVVGTVARPIMQLKGFRKVPLNPGEKAKVTFKINSEILSFYNEDMKLVIEPGIFEIMIGSSSKDIRLKGKFEIKGKTKVIKKRKVFFSEVEVKYQ